MKNRLFRFCRANGPRWRPDTLWDPKSESTPIPTIDEVVSGLGLALAERRYYAAHSAARSSRLRECIEREGVNLDDDPPSIL